MHRAVNPRPLHECRPRGDGVGQEGFGWFQPTVTVPTLFSGLHPVNHQRTTEQERRPEKPCLRPRSKCPHKTRLPEMPPDRTGGNSRVATLTTLREANFVCIISF